MRKLGIGLAVVVLLITGRSIYHSLHGFVPSPVREDEYRKFVFVCTESGEKFVLPGKQGAEINPKTGKPTLAPGLYCEECRQWRAAPSVAILQQTRRPVLCPVHKKPMTANEPISSAKG